jgi:hypothetical protein
VKGAGRVRAAAAKGRFRLLLASLLVLAGVGAPAVSGLGHVERLPASVAGASVSAVQPTYDALHDRPRGAVTAGHSSPTSAPDTWWGVCLPAHSGGTPHGRPTPGAAGGTRAPATVSAQWSSRAPPRA